MRTNQSAWYFTRTRVLHSALRAVPRAAWGVTCRSTPFLVPPYSRYEKAQKPLSTYEADINEFINKQDEVAHEESTANVKFLFIDCGPLKQALRCGGRARPAQP